MNYKWIIVQISYNFLSSFICFILEAAYNVQLQSKDPTVGLALLFQQVKCLYKICA